MFEPHQIPAELVFHFLRVDKNVITKPILHLERSSVEQRVFRVSSRLIHIVRCESDFLAAHLIEEHQDSAIEKLKFVVPQDMENMGIGASGVLDQLRIVDQRL